MKSAEEWAGCLDKVLRRDAPDIVERIREEMRQECAGAVPLRAILDWWMCSDPWPGGNHDSIAMWLNIQCRKQGYDNWVTAFHKMPKEATE